MRIEMKEGEREILHSMLEGPITPACASLYARVRRRLLLSGHSYDMPKEMLALIAELSDAVSAVQPTEKQLVLEPEIPSDIPEPTPVDELTLSERAMIEAQNAELNLEAAGGEYRGPRIPKWESVFKSTPKTPISKWEKGRPIMYRSPKDGQIRAGRFVKLLARDKKLATVFSSEMKKAFPVPTKDIEAQDLSPPSTIPLAVQI